MSIWKALTHGWVVDGQGRAMHKSLGNGIDPADLIKDFGADIIRLWAASSDYHADVRCSEDIFKQIAQNYLKFRNTARYCLGNLAELFLVSSVSWGASEEGALTGTGSRFESVTVGVSEAKGEKCPRCWMHSLAADGNGLCPRCAAVVSKLDLEI